MESSTAITFTTFLNNTTRGWPFEPDRIYDLVIEQNTLIAIDSRGQYRGVIPSIQSTSAVWTRATSGERIHFIITSVDTISTDGNGLEIIEGKGKCVTLNEIA